MDTSWYAVDRDGRVALFTTGENGHAPAQARDASHLERLHQEVYGDGGAEYRPDYDLAEQFGFFLYGYADNNYLPVGKYDRQVAPTRPAHVDQLPPDVRADCKKVVLPVAFAEAERVQPMAFFECAMWYRDSRHAYLDADGVTVRPVPGHEDRFADSVGEIRAHWGEACPYRFEGMDDGR
jgi:hypothetical protein